MIRIERRACRWLVFVALLASTPPLARAADPDGIRPLDARGRPLNLDFEDGTLRDWTADGPAFDGQPVEGDTVRPRRGDMSSRHQGRFWVGSYENRKGDDARGTLTSVPFRVAQPYASFLVAGGSGPETRVELVRADTGAVVAQASGHDSEELKRVAVDLDAHRGKELIIRLVDARGGGWGHLNFDDFRFHAARPPYPGPAAILVADTYAHAGLDPRAAAGTMTVPDGFRVDLVAGEPDVRQPIAFAIDRRGRLWVAEAYSYPVRVAPELARDRILIFEDADGDGRYEHPKVFADKLNLVSGIELGFGGVYVGAAPELLFIADLDGDDRPDGPPRVLLDGWGFEDTHETLNSFNWGPDGWLYGCHGVFTHSKVGKPGTPAADRTPIDAGIWRYHPTRHVFEVFAEGTSNPWGVDFDPKGQAFETACVIPHLYHVIPGGRYERQAGPHANPHTYDDIKTIADHRHYPGDRPHATNGRADASGGGHAHAGALIYQGGAWPAAYRGSIFMNNIHGARLNRDTLRAEGSGFVGGHAPDFLLANDSWSQIVSLKSGPDGQVYFIDWYDRQQCHVKGVDAHDRGNGRIFRATYGSDGPVKVDVGRASLAELVAYQSHPNDWHARQARRVLQERGPDPAARAALLAAYDAAPDEVGRLRVLWCLSAVGAVDDALIDRCLADPSGDVRGWAVRLAVDAGVPSREVLARFADLAATDPSPVLRLALASALQRLPNELRWPILEKLAGHSEDAGDHNIPLMLWYAAEPLAEADPARALRLALGSKVPPMLTFMVRRLGSIGTPAAFGPLVEALGRDRGEGGAGVELTLLQGINRALQGRRRSEMPAGWPAAFARLSRHDNPGVRSQLAALASAFGDPAALLALRTALADPATDLPLRREALAALLKARDLALVPTLHALADRALAPEALRALAAFDDPSTTAIILKAYPDLGPAERRDARGTLAARPGSARALLSAVAEGRIPASDLSADLVRQIRNHRDADLDSRIAQVWGTARDTSVERAGRIASAKAMLLAKPPQAADASLGRAVFAKTCQQCHILFGTGSQVGPELTGSNRADLDYLLANIYDPSALIGKDYQAQILATVDGRVLTGLVRAETPDAITLVTANETVVVPRPEIDERTASDKSMMPEDLLTPLSEHEIRSLVAYLASPAQVPILATPETALSFFNGRDLAGWVGDPANWSVEAGAIIGKTAGPAGAILTSDLLAGDFRLTFRYRSSAPGAAIRVRAEPDLDGSWSGPAIDLTPGDWDTCEIIAEGAVIRAAINDRPAVTIDDPSIARRGRLALQLRAGGPTEVRFKGLKLQPLGASGR